MLLAQERVLAYGVRFTIHAEERLVGRAFLYVLSNDLHDRPFGLLEDVFVEPDFRGKGVGKLLIEAAIDHARKEKCYKLLATSRNDGSRQGVQAWYVRLGFEAYGTEFRLNMM